MASPARCTKVASNEAKIRSASQSTKPEKAQQSCSPSQSLWKRRGFDIWMQLMVSSYKQEGQKHFDSPNQFCFSQERQATLQEEGGWGEGWTMSPKPKVWCSSRKLGCAQLFRMPQLKHHWHNYYTFRDALHRCKSQFMGQINLPTTWHFSCVKLVCKTPNFVQGFVLA